MARSVNCETCHGAGAEHAKGSARMVVPSALAPPARDSVCAQCHLQGAIQVSRPGKSLKQFRPGDELSRFIATFVSDPASTPASHVESLYASRCRQKAPDALWCGSCHDVHDASVLPNACLQCHTDRNCGKGADCVACHMPKRIGGFVRTDHSIPRLARDPVPPLPLERLRALSPLDAGDRELGLAYAALARSSGSSAAAGEADRILKRIPKPDREVKNWLKRKAK